MGLNSYSSKVQAIGVPAGLNSDLCLNVPVAMTLAGQDQEMKVICLKMQELVIDSSRQRARTTSMVRIVTIVLSATVMQEGEGFDNQSPCSGGLCQQQAVAPNSGPMRRPVNASPVKGKVPA
jgi:hypothetical protein